MAKVEDLHVSHSAFWVIPEIHTTNIDHFDEEPKSKTRPADLAGAITTIPLKKIYLILLTSTALNQVPLVVVSIDA